MKTTCTIFLILIGCARAPDTDRVARLESMLSTEATATTETKGDDDATGYKVGDYCLIDYVLDHCPPCARWAATEEHKVNCKVERWNVSQRPLGFVTVAPTFRLLWCNPETKQWEDIHLWTGFVSAANINSKIESHKASQAKLETEQVTP